MPPMGIGAWVTLHSQSESFFFGFGGGYSCDHFIKINVSIKFPLEILWDSYLVWGLWGIKEFLRDEF